MARPFGQHISGEELEALVVISRSQGGAVATNPVQGADRHVAECEECKRKVAAYRCLIEGLSRARVSKAAWRRPDCPRDEDVEWHEIAAGLWPETKARYLLIHAALCEYCGPRLRAATSADGDPTADEERLLAQLRMPSRPNFDCRPVVHSAAESRRTWWPVRWLVPVLALILVVGVYFTTHRSHRKLDGREFAELAAQTQRQYADGRLALDVRSDSQQAVNEWFKTNLPFALALPASAPLPGEPRPYRLEGARLMKVGGKKAAYIAYMLQSGPASLTVTTDSAADARGGVVVDYKKVSFHYRMVQGYRVVTWSLRGKSYALVSREGSNTQNSCMVCHSAMHDRDLSRTPPPPIHESSI